MDRPEWYDDTFDKYPNVINEMENIDKLESEGYIIPDSDGSRDSESRNQTIINNTFNLSSVRGSLKDIYLNSYYKLMANANDNVHFHKWEGNINDYNSYDKINRMYEFKLPWDMFIYPGDRDKFKLSQFYRKWIKVEDLLNNWNIFKWHILVFINQRVYSEYQLYIQEQEVIIRFACNDVWLNKNYPLYIYKFDTNYQKRILISKYQLNNQWQWKMPLIIFNDGISNHERIMVAINKISDINIRHDGNTNIEVLGDNIEFLPVDRQNGYIDMSLISQINVDYILSEESEYLWMSIFVPKFMQEYPKFLVTDIIYRPYVPLTRPVQILQQNIPKDVMADINNIDYISNDTRNVYIDDNMNFGKEYDGWTNVIRPIVLSDAYRDHIEPYDVLRDEIDSFRNNITIFTDTMGEFINYINNDKNKNYVSWNYWIELFKSHGINLYESQGRFLDKRLCPRYSDIEIAYDEFINDIETIRNNEWYVIRIPDTFYPACKIMIDQCWLLFDKYHIADIIRNINKDNLWIHNHEYDGKIRYQRPIDSSNFWCFEYNIDDTVWRPVSKKITRYYPDVYYIESFDGTTNPNGVYKAFFFYSDTINVRQLYSDDKIPLPAYDESYIQYEKLDGIYHDMIIEKFYWMALTSIYQGLLFTNSRWEIIEYVINNPSYMRFNKLFFETEDPYFKLSLATYLKGNNAQFPFDDAISKLNEAITLKWNGYNNIQNFEKYLHNQWIPSYFDYIITMYDDYDLTNRIIKRPPLSFDIRNLHRNIMKTFSLLDNTILNDFKDATNNSNASDELKIRVINLIDLIMNSNYRNDIESTITKCIYDDAIYASSNIQDISNILIEYNSMVRRLIDESIIMESYIDSNIVHDNSNLSYERILKIINYIKIIMIDYIPDKSLPLYLDVYESSGVVILLPGMDYEINSQLYVPELGVYRINAIGDDGSIQSLLSDNSYYKKSFNTTLNRLNKNTVGIGSGNIINPNSENVTHIMKNEIVKRVIDSINNIISTSKRTIDIINPHENINFTRVVTLSKNIKSDWNNILKVYQDHINSAVIDRINDMMTPIDKLILDDESFMISRDKIDLKNMINKLLSSIDEVRQISSSDGWFDSEVEQVDIDARSIYNDSVIFYANGNKWNDKNKLQSLLDDIQSIHDRYYAIIMNQQNSSNREKLINIIGLLQTSINSIINGLSELPDKINIINNDIINIESILNMINVDALKDDQWYHIDDVNISMPGNNYYIGQIVYITIDDAYKSMSGYRLCFQVKSIDSSGVASVIPMFDYALTDQLWGAFDAINTFDSNSYGLRIDIKSKLITPHSLIIKEDAFKINPNEYDNDLVTFKFENIYDLDMHYEIFAGGKQIIDFYQRHMDSDYKSARKIDVLYVDANKINNLKNSSIYIPENNYAVYQIDSIDIIAPGKGYHINQEVYVNINEYRLKLLVSKLLNEPFKGIAELSIADNNISYIGNDPSGSNLQILHDIQNNIDDEYGISEDDDVYGNWNDDYQYGNPQLPNPMVDPPVDNGDPYYHWYLGDRIDNSITGNTDNRWNGIVPTQNHIDPYIEDYDRVPFSQPIKGDYQLIDRLLICNESTKTNTTLSVDSIDQLPVSTDQWVDMMIGNNVSVEVDDNHNKHRWIYTTIGVTYTGIIVYDNGYADDVSWNNFNIDWMNIDSYRDIPTLYGQYPYDEFTELKDYAEIERNIKNRELERKFNPIKNYTSYIDQLTINDLSVYNWTNKTWEDLTDTSRWSLSIRNDNINNDYGFTLTFLLDGSYEYDMQLFLNKTTDTQKRNQLLLGEPSTIDIISSIVDEINLPEDIIEVDTGRSVRIRKLFPYEQRNHFIINEENKNDGINIKLAKYMHYRNEIHLCDIMLFNKNTSRFENIFDTTKFDIWVKDITRLDDRNKLVSLDNVQVVNDNDNLIYPPEYVNVVLEDQSIIPFYDIDRVKIIETPPNLIDAGYENIMKYNNPIITNSGSRYHDGYSWAYNELYDIRLFGNIITENGSITSFIIMHIDNMPINDGIYDFKIYQNNIINNSTVGSMSIKFEKTFERMYDDGYIHNVINPMAILPANELKIIPKYSIQGNFEYDVIISKTTRRWKYFTRSWLVEPRYTIDDYQCPGDRFYVLINNVRFPLINPSSGNPTFIVNNLQHGMSIQIKNIIRRDEHIEIRSLPYPIRSVYVQKLIPANGYINLKGKLNKPLNKKYYEFWVNGKLLHDEVNIITPSKLFLHGLTSLKNFEIIEINRDESEIFSDNFLNIEINNNIPSATWDYSTYLDAVLEGSLDGENYTLEEQSKLISPIWPQVIRNNPNYKKYPENSDLDNDIMIRVFPEDGIVPELENAPLEYLDPNPPRIEDIPLTTPNLTWEDFGFKPIQRQTLIDTLNEIWIDEIKEDPYFGMHVIISQHEWYGVTIKMYDQNGVITSSMDNCAYIVLGDKIINIDSESHKVNISDNITDIELN